MIAYTWMRDAEILNRYGFQGKEWEDKTQWYDFHARQYDPVLGRWFALDPANQFASGYMGMGDNPVIGVDPDGRVFWLIPVAAAALIGGTINWAMNGAKFDNQGLKYFGVGALSGMASLVGGPGGAMLSGAVLQGGNAAVAGASGADILRSSFMGAFTGLAGFGVGQGVNRLLPRLTNGIGNHILKSTVANGIGFGVTGFAVGGIADVMSGGNFWDGAWKGGLFGLGMGVTYGFGRGLHNEYMMRHSPAPSVTSPNLGSVERPEHIYPSRSNTPPNSSGGSVLPDNVYLGRGDFVGKTSPQGGLNLFKSGTPHAMRVRGWKSGDYMLHLPDKGTPKLNWQGNYGALRREMRLGKPIFDSYRFPNGNIIPTGGFLNAERSILQGRGWIYNPGSGAWMPPGF